MSLVRWFHCESSLSVRPAPLGPEAPDDTFHNIYHVSEYFSQYLLKIFCEILHTDFTKMAALQKFRFAAAIMMLPERIPTATMLTASSRSQS